MTRYTLRQLEYFVAVAEQGTLAGAAEVLMISQSAVSGAVNELEKAFGAQLTIRRKAHGVTLTPSGTYVLEQARSLLNLAGDLELHAGQPGEQLRGPLLVGCYLSLAPTVLARLLSNYSERHPQVELDFFAGTQTEVLERLSSGQLDLAILYDMGLSTQMASQKLEDRRPAVVLSADHPLASQERIELAQLADDALILLDVNPSRENTMMMFSEAGVQPRITFRTTDYEVTRSLVGRGMGYTILAQRPSGDITYEGRPLAVRPIHPPVRSVPVVIGWNAAVQPSMRSRAMLELAGELYPGTV